MALSPRPAESEVGWANETSELHFPSDSRQLVGTPVRRAWFDVGVLAPRSQVATLLTAVAILAHRYTHQEVIPLHLLVRNLGRPDEAPELGLLLLPIQPDDPGASCVARAAAAMESLPATPGSSDVLVAFVEPTDDPGALDEFVGALAFVFTSNEQGHLLRLGYDSAAFLPTTIERIARHLSTLLAGLAEHPECAVAQLPLLTDTETRFFLEEWNDASQADSHALAPLPLRRWVAHRAHLSPERTALRHRERSLSYAELDSRANRLAHHLLQLGIAKGDRVAVCVAPSFDIVVALLALFEVGAVHVPLDPTYPVERLTTILADVEPRLILAHEEFRARLHAPGVPFFALDVQAAELDVYPSEATGIDIQPSDLAYVIYTSGTTGLPKGVMTNHANLTHFVKVAVDKYELDERDVVPAMARFSFSITMFEMFLPLVVGAELVLLDRDHVVDFPRLAETLRRCTLVHSSPSLLRKFVAYARDEGVPASHFDNLRHVSSGGDFVSADLLESLKPLFRRAELFVIYGCSEIACMGCSFAVPREQTLTRSKVGTPFPNVRVRILDARGNLVPIGVAGEVHFAGAGVTPGYFKRPALTEERYVNWGGERYYRTGDVGRYDAEGNVELLGRSDFQIKLRGMRIELGDIEAALRRAPGVRDAVAAAHTPVGREKLLVAYLVLDGDAELPPIRTYLTQQLPDYMVPSAFVLLPALPVNMNMKLDRKALPEPTAEDFLRHLTLVPAANDHERRLLAIWQRVLGTTAVGVCDNFFEAGGDSLMALPLMIEIERAFGVVLPMSLLLTEPTVRSLAATLAAPATQLRPALIPLRTGGGDVPLFLVHDGEGECIPYRRLAECLPGDRPVYGIQPHGSASFPMLHSRLDDVARHYVEVVRRTQPEGPYFLGGLCIGGFIAFEMARLLRAAGQAVDLVALIDVAHVTLPPKGLSQARMNRLGSALRAPGEGGRLQRAGRLLRIVGGRAFNVLRYETTNRSRIALNRLKMRLFRTQLDLGMEPARYLANIPVRVVLRFAEREYVIPRPYEGRAVLIRATKKDPAYDGSLIDDTPYIDLFDDPLLGWEGKTTSPVTVHDVAGGHSSMLQDPNVLAVARILDREARLAASDRRPS
ncbi:MAG TPA: amino acid adenylation domain-containing protein [Polyangiaceae bacterium]|nr:amino acid adenylation domain-containing protein [Polyangiaceae bacterium]